MRLHYLFSGVGEPTNVTTNCNQGKQSLFGELKFRKKKKKKSIVPHALRDKVWTTAKQTPMCLCRFLPRRQTMLGHKPCAHAM